MLDTVVFDVDGTLVDSSYHHLIAWSRAFAAVGVTVPGCKLHALMGMGGDQLVAAAANDSVERALGDEIRDLWRHEYGALLSEVRPFPDAVAVLEEFRHAGIAVVLATSGNEDHIDRTLDILELGKGAYPLVSSADVEDTKPAGDLIELAMGTVGGTAGVLVGDTVWDVEAGRRAGLPVLSVRTGGIADERLREAGAARVFDDVAEIRAAVPELVQRFAYAPAPANLTRLRQGANYSAR